MPSAKKIGFGDIVPRGMPFYSGNIIYRERIALKEDCDLHINIASYVGALHNCGISIYYGQKYWYSTDNSWSYEYNLKKPGILKSPVIKAFV